MNRLLIVTTVPDTLRAFFLPFADHYRALGWRVDALARRASQDAVTVRAFDHAWDAEWSRNPLKPRHLIVEPRAIRSLVTREGYDIVHTHTPIASFVTRFALRSLRRSGRPKIVYTAHGFHFYRGGPPVRNAAFQSLERMAGPWTDHLIVMNQEDFENARALRLVPDTRLTFMSGIGVDADAYDPSAVHPDDERRVRAEMGVPPDAPLFLMVAEFIPRKRHIDALNAFAALDRPTAHLALAGDGPLSGEMEAQAIRLNIKDRCHFLGRRSDIPVLVRASAALLLPSLYEGLPRSVMESLCLERPVIGADIRGTRDILQDGYGLLVPAKDPAALAEAMRRIIDHPDEASEIGKRGRQKMLGAYSQRAILEAHDSLYASLLSEAHDGR